MSYPVINDSFPEDDKVRILADQVAELLRDNVGFTEAMSAVVTHRYAGRFKDLRGKVQAHLNQRSRAVVRKNAARGQMSLVFS